MKHIVMFLSNAYRPDPRVEREAAALASAGYRVTVICWDREAALPALEQAGGVEIRRIHSIKTRYGAGPRQLLKIPLFWSAAVRLASELHPDAVHCHDLDTLYAGVRLKRKLGIPLVFDAHEDYPALMSLYLPGFMVSWLRLFERLLMGRADAILTASTVYAQKLTRQGLKNVTPVPNVQELEDFEAITPLAVQTARRQLGLDEGQFAVAYLGGFTRNRQLLPFIEAARSLPEMRFFLWGDGHQRQAVERAIQGAEHIHYLGWLPAGQVPLMCKAVDALYYCLREDYPGAQFNAPNTLSHAMCAGTPLIANPVGDLGWTVKNAGCGLLVEPVTPDVIRQALLELADPELRARLGAAGYSYAKGKYNWRAISTGMLQVYQGILDQK